MADTTSLVATEKFEKGGDMASDIQTWYRALNVNSLTSLTAVEEGSVYVRLIAIYTTT